MSQLSLPSGLTIGYAEQGFGYPVILLPGSAVDHSIFIPGGQIAALSEHFRVIAIDWRGTGQSDRSDADYGAPDLADDVLGIMDALSIDRAHVVGMSQGSLIAQRLAAEHPNRVNRLVLYSTWDYTDEYLRRMFTIWQHLYRTAEPQEYGEATLWFLLSLQFIDANSDFVSSMAADSFAGPSAATRHAQLQAVKINLAHDGRDMLQEIAAPTLVIAGSDDRTIPVGYSERAASAIATATLEVIRGPGSSHALFLERGGEVNQQTLDFLRPEK